VAVHEREELLEVLTGQDLVLDHVADRQGHS